MELNLDKIKLILSRMDEPYWNGVVNRMTALGEQAAQLTGELKDTFTKLTVTQVGIVETKYKGYQLLAENKKKTAAAKIVDENKDRICQLLHEKHQTVTALVELMAAFNTIIEEAQTLGETLPPAPPSNGGDENNG